MKCMRPSGMFCDLYSLHRGTSKHCTDCYWVELNIVEEENIGIKHDEGKLRMDLIPPEVEQSLAEILTYGAKKYKDRNWEKGIKYGRVYAALRRHLLAWTEGEENDQESGLPHIKHALCCLAFLVTYEARNMRQWDDIHGTNKAT